MRVGQDELGRRLERFKSACRDAGVRRTHQRIEIFREVAASGEHPDAETVFDGVRERVPTVSLDTVYRTLRFLEDLGLVTTLGPRRERTRFDANLGSHHHFVCERCGRVRDFESRELGALDASEQVKPLGAVSRVLVEVRGVCRECCDGRSPESAGDDGGHE
jgi:Fur family peroxide stress response transcriptional regulator